VQFARNYRDDYPMTHWRLIGEMNIFSEQRGFGRFGGDFWPVLKDARGRAVGTVATRYPETRWRNLSIATSLLRPGEKGRCRPRGWR